MIPIVEVERYRMSQIFISNTTGMDTYVVRRTDLDLDFGSIKRSDVVVQQATIKRRIFYLEA